MVRVNWWTYINSAWYKVKCVMRREVVDLGGIRDMIGDVMIFGTNKTTIFKILLYVKSYQKFIYHHLLVSINIILGSYMEYVMNLCLVKRNKEMEIGWKEILSIFFLPWTWANSRRWWRTGRPGVLQSMGLQRLGDWTTIRKYVCVCVYTYKMNI